MSLFPEFVDEVIRIEGGYVNRPDDSGGPTKYGITQAVARRFGYKGDMRDLPRSLAVHIYKVGFWDELKLDDIEKLSPGIASELADTGINQGIGRAAAFLQRILNVMNNKGEYYPDIVVDSQIGPGTLAAFRSYLKKRPVDGETVMLRALNALQGAFYIELAERRVKDEAFVYGWLLNRVI